MSCKRVSAGLISSLDSAWDLLSLIGLCGRMNRITADDSMQILPSEPRFPIRKVRKNRKILQRLCLSGHNKHSGGRTFSVISGPYLVSKTTENSCPTLHRVNSVPSANSPFGVRKPSANRPQRAGTSSYAIHLCTNL